jgi:hypothetical protein
MARRRSFFFGRVVPCSGARVALREIKGGASPSPTAKFDGYEALHSEVRWKRAPTVKFGGTLRLNVGDALGAGLGKVLLVPGDGAIGPIDDVFGFANTVTFARVANEDSFGADIF